MKSLFGVLGFIFGAGLDSGTGAVFGLAIGVLTGALLQYRDRISELEQSLELLRTRLNLLSPEQTKRSNTEANDVQTAVAIPDKLEPPDEIKPVEILPDPNFEPAVERFEPGEVQPVSSSEDHSPSAPGLFDQIGEFVRDFFTTGNVVVKVAIIILFFGLSFLIKYAFQHNLLSLELRLIGIALFGAVLLLIGWRLRLKNSLYALVLQGGAIGILYLTVFSAGRLEIIPMGLAFFILFVLVVLSCLLAVKQDAKSLALFATAGGFLAPILTSTGQGSHVTLLSYYAVLNIGIFVLAWFKSWRSLNWLGFVFTFVIASMWGMKYYQPQYFHTTEPFLILFFLFYVAISVLFAFRQPPDLKGLVDGSLVFGTPLVGFTLQSQLVKDFEYGHAWSALVIGLLYFALHRFLKAKSITGMQALSDSFLALAVVFLTLTIPFTLDGHWTAAAWALEGAGILWIGLRQHQLLTKCFGLLLQVAAAFMFVERNDVIGPHMGIANSMYIGSLMISLAGLFSSYQYSLYEKGLSNFESALPKLLFYWGMLWWFGINLYEIQEHVAEHYQVNVVLLFISLSCLAMVLIAQQLKWSFPEKNTIAFLPVLVLFVFLAFVVLTNSHPLDNLGFIAWPLAFFVQYLLLYRNDRKWDRHLLMICHAIVLWIILFILCWLVVDVINHYLPSLSKWSYLFWGLVPVSALLLLFQYKDHQHWPFKTYQSSYFSGGITPVLAYLVIWFTVICGERADPSPLPYLPILNPQDIAQLLVLGFLIYCVVQWQRHRLPKPDIVNDTVAYSIIGVISFIWLNALVAHAVHFYADVNFNPHSMLNSDLFQTVISIIWTLTAFALMSYATKKELRPIWFVGAALLAVVVLKLFVIDLEESGTVTRIVSFLSVGGLMLIIGYFSPIPPKPHKKQSAL